MVSRDPKRLEGGAAAAAAAEEEWHDEQGRRVEKQTK
jgi:hypothetical protein